MANNSISTTTVAPYPYESDNKDMLLIISSISMVVATIALILLVCVFMHFMHFYEPCYHVGEISGEVFAGR